MNNLRRKRIAKLVDMLSNVKEAFESIAEDEEEYIDNIPENLQNSSRYEEAEEALYNLNEVVSFLDDAIETLSYFTEN